MPSRGDTLLHLVYEHPEDDGARRSYADWLIEQGDVRGELIVLQLRRAAKGGTIAAERREVELLLEYGRPWLGRFAKHFESFRFERGFLASCKLKSLTKPMIGDRSWATLENVRFIAVDGLNVAAFLSHPVMRALREAHNVGPVAFAELQAPGRGANLRTLHVASPSAISLERAKSRGGLAHLERLTFD